MEFLRKLFASLHQQGLKFCTVTTDSSMNVGIIFETLNNRGLKLTALELVKNYLLYKIIEARVEDRQVTFILSFMPLNNTWQALQNETLDAYGAVLACLAKKQLYSASEEDEFLTTVCDFLQGHDNNHIFDRVKQFVDTADKIRPFVRAIKDTIIFYTDLYRPGTVLFQLSFILTTIDNGSFTYFDSLQTQFYNWASRVNDLKKGVRNLMPLLLASFLRFSNQRQFLLDVVKVRRICITFRVTLTTNADDRNTPFYSLSC